MSVTGSNPMSTKDDIVAALVVSGIHTFAIHGADAEAYRNFVKQTLACEPHIVIDDGGDLVHELHSLYPEYAKHTIGACEETTTGVLRAVAREKNGALNFLVLSINGAQSKHLFDNRYGTGQSTFDGIMRTTNLVIAENRGRRRLRLVRKRLCHAGERTGRGSDCHRSGSDKSPGSENGRLCGHDHVRRSTAG